MCKEAAQEQRTMRFSSVLVLLDKVMVDFGRDCFSPAGEMAREGAGIPAPEESASQLKLKSRLRSRSLSILNKCVKYATILLICTSGSLN